MFSVHSVVPIVNQKEAPYFAFNDLSVYLCIFIYDLWKTAINPLSAVHHLLSKLRVWYLCAGTGRVILLRASDTRMAYDSLKSKFYD